MESHWLLHSTVSVQAALTKPFSASGSRGEEFSHCRVLALYVSIQFVDSACGEGRARSFFISRSHPVGNFLTLSVGTTFGLMHFVRPTPLLYASMIISLSVICSARGNGSAMTPTSSSICRPEQCRVDQEEAIAGKPRPVLYNPRGL